MSIHNSKLSFVLSALTASMIVSACGGAGDTAGIGGSGFISSGSVTGFGSVFVNGVEFETGSAIFDIEDDLNKTQADLRIGMVVQVEGSINSDGVTGTASGIQYSDDIEGPVSNAPVENADKTEKTFFILGKKVVISISDTAYEGLTYNSILQGNVLEVSGFFDQSGTLRASYIELKSNTFDATTIVEVKGVITNLSGSRFELQGITVDASSANLSDLVNGLQNDVLVEVKGTFNTANNTITATEVEAENSELSDSADKVEIEGLITRFASNSDFDINGIKVNVSNAIFTPAILQTQLKLGDKVEAEGAMLNGVLIALKVEARGGNAEASATVGTIDLINNSFTMAILSGQFITVQLTASTRMEDDAGNDDHLLLTELQTGNFVNVKGFESGVSTITATQVKRESEVKEVELQGLVAAPVPNGSITVLDVTFLVDNDTSYEDANDNTINHSDFITAATSGTVVSIKDKKSGDGNLLGTADEVEIEN